MATPGNPLRYRTHRSAPPVSALAHSGDFFLSRYEFGFLRLLQVKLSFFWHVFLLLSRSRNRDFSRLEHLQTRVTYKKKTFSLTPVTWLYFEAKLEKSNDFSRRKRERGGEKQRRQLRPQATEYKGNVCVRERGWERERQTERESERKTTNAVRERDHQQLEMKCTTSAETSWSPGVLVWLAEEPYKCSEREKASERDHLQV